MALFVKQPLLNVHFNFHRKLPLLTKANHRGGRTSTGWEEGLHGLGAGVLGFYSPRFLLSHQRSMSGDVG